MALMVDGALIEETRERVLAWFAEAGRDLPWRATRDPYRVLVAEVLAQQTQAARAAAAWPRFLERFPDAAALAAAAPAEVLRAWQGLGYNRRALALHRTAQAVEERGGWPVEERGGWPDTVEELATLPGVGPYTARAVACFALGRRVAPVDTNVARVWACDYGHSTAGLRDRDAAVLSLVRQPQRLPAGGAHAAVGAAGRTAGAAAAAGAGGDVAPPRVCDRLPWLPAGQPRDRPPGRVT
jgi:adenine-specific DNA glycosylase